MHFLSLCIIFLFLGILLNVFPLTPEILDTLCSPIRTRLSLHGVHFLFYRRSFDFIAVRIGHVCGFPLIFYADVSEKSDTAATCHT